MADFGSFSVDLGSFSTAVGIFSADFGSFSADLGSFSASVSTFSAAVGTLSLSVGASLATIGALSAGVHVQVMVSAVTAWLIRSWLAPSAGRRVAATEDQPRLRPGPQTQPGGGQHDAPGPRSPSLSAARAVIAGATAAPACSGPGAPRAVPAGAVSTELGGRVRRGLGPGPLRLGVLGVLCLRRVGGVRAATPRHPFRRRDHRFRSAFNG